MGPIQIQMACLSETIEVWQILFDTSQKGNKARTCDLTYCPASTVGRNIDPCTQQLQGLTVPSSGTLRDQDKTELGADYFSRLTMLQGMDGQLVLIVGNHFSPCQSPARRRVPCGEHCLSANSAIKKSSISMIPAKGKSKVSPLVPSWDLELLSTV